MVLFPRSRRRKQRPADGPVPSDGCPLSDLEVYWLAVAEAALLDEAGTRRVAADEEGAEMLAAAEDGDWQ